MAFRRSGVRTPSAPPISRYHLGLRCASRSKRPFDGFPLWRLLTFIDKKPTLILQDMSSINLSLTDELRAFIDKNSGDGTLFSTPSEFLRDVLREKKERMEAAEMRDAILEGYRDLIEHRTVEFKGNLRATLKEAKRREKQNWK
jgi:antitoxin ParD1/3/4